MIALIQKIILNIFLYFFDYSFRECPKNINEKRKYIVEGENKNILIKTSGNTYYSGAICKNELDKSIDEHRWKIKFLKTKERYIMVGVAPINFDFNQANYNTCG